MPLFAVLARTLSPWRALWSGYIAGVIFFGESCPWIQATVHHFGDLSPAVATLVFVLFLLLMGSYLAFFSVAAWWLGCRIGHRLLPLPFLWIAVEWLRTITPMGGFPWNLLGYSQIDHAGFMLVLPVAGIYGASFLIALVNTLAAAILLRSGRGWRKVHTIEAVALGALFAFATWPYHPPTHLPPSLHARLLQPNTPLDGGWPAARLQAFLSTQQQLSIGDPGTPPPQLIVWPEQPAPLSYALEPDLQRAVAEIMATTHAALLFEEVTYGLTPQGTPDYSAPRNSAQYITPDGSTGPRYDKIHLVPFGEYIPLPQWFIRLGGIGKLVQGVGDFIPGTSPVMFHLDGRPFATMICYESIFPALARRETAAGAQWLVNQSDDSWYGNSSAAAQGLMMARARAIENRRWLLRSTDDGYTAVIDPWGRITAQLPRFTSTALDAGFVPRTDITFYTRHEDWCADLCLVLCLAFLSLALLRRPRAALVQ